MHSPAFQGPLAGLRVVEVAAIGPVPLAAMLLADLGADVVRIDRTEASGLGLNVASRHDVAARNRRSIALDLKHDAARAVALRLIERADVFVEGLRPGACERLGLGPDALLAASPRLVYGRMTGWGQTGPLAGAAGHDLNYIALAGVLHAVGPDSGPPLPPLNLVGDYGGGALYLAFGVLAALHERARSGRGQVVDAAMVDGAASLASLFWGLHAAGDWRRERGTNLLDGGAPFYACYATADGGWLSVAALEAKFFAEFARRIDLDARFVTGQYDRSLWPAMREAIAAALVTRSRDEWAAVFDGSDACVAPVLSFDEAPQHPHARARGAFVDVAGVVQPAPAPRFSRTPAATPRAAPDEGGDTAAVLAELGYAAADIDALRASGAAR